MAKYGYFLYGLKPYGEVEANKSAYQAGLTAWNYGYGQVLLEWKSFTTNLGDPDPTHWRLIRSYAGIPNDPYLGDFLDGDTIANYRLSHVDNDPTLNTELIAYYSLWAFNGDKWIRVGQDVTPLAHDNGSATTFFRWLPAAWLNEANGYGDTTGNAESDNALVNWLSGFVFAYDRMRSEVELVAQSSDYRKIPTQLLKTAITELDLSYEPALGDIYHRSLYRSGHVINATKGSAKAIKNYATALTHWGASVTPGSNLLLNYNDSSFEDGIGNWSTTDSFVARKYAASFGDVGVVLASPVSPMKNTLFPTRSTGYGLATYPATGSWEASLGIADGTSSGASMSVPVTPNEVYAFSTYVQHLDSAATVSLQIHWADSRNNILSSSTAITATTTASWQRVLSNATAPAKAAFASFTLAITGGTPAARFVFDKFQFSQSDVSDRYEEAKTTAITLSGQRTNFLPNCGFDGSLTGWSSLNGTLSQAFTKPAGVWYYGTAVAKLTVTSTAKSAFMSSWVPINPGAPYTFSIYVTSAAAAAQEAVARIEFTQPQANSDQNRVINDTNGTYFATSSFYQDSASVTITPIPVGTYQRLSVTTISPSFTRDSGSALAKVSIYFPNAQAGDVFYFDGGLLEESPSVKDFFQGNGSPAVANPAQDVFISPNDCRWEMGYQINFVSNPSFDTTTDWTATNATLTSLSTGTNGIDATESNFFGRMVATNNVAQPGTLSTTVYHPRTIYGGEAVSVSVRVRGAAGTYTMTAGTTTVTQVVAAADTGYWTTIALTRYASVGETSFPFSLAFSSGSASVTWYVDGVQAEYNPTATWIVDTSNVETSMLPNPKQPSKNIFLAYAPLKFSGRSYYWANYQDKLLRLVNTLERYVPLNSDWQVRSGDPTPPEPNIPGSLLMSSSFENSLRGWSTSNAGVTRSVSKGTHFTEYAAHGASWATVTRTASSPAAYGIVSEPVYIQPGRGYYLAAAVRPADASSAGTYSIKVEWLDENKTLITSKTETKTLTNTSVWNYMALTDTAAITATAVSLYAKVTISSTPTNNTGAKTFYVDRILFRE